MDRISALRNVEDALADFEAGDADLSALERRVQGILRTYAAAQGGRSAWRVRAPGALDGLVVLAESRAAARGRIAEEFARSDDADFELERVRPDEG